MRGGRERVTEKGEPSGACGKVLQKEGRTTVETVEAKREGQRGGIGRRAWREKERAKSVEREKVRLHDCLVVREATNEVLVDGS
jgi:hypothetical protein